MSVEMEIEVLELAADLLAADPICSAYAISDAVDRLLPPPNWGYADWVVMRTWSRWWSLPSSSSEYLDVKLQGILERLQDLRRLP